MKQIKKYNVPNHNVSEVPIRTNHGNQIQSQPHGSKPLSPPTHKENKSKKWGTTLHPKKPPSLLCIPQETLVCVLFVCLFVC